MPETFHLDPFTPHERYAMERLKRRAYSPHPYLSRLARQKMRELSEAATDRATRDAEFMLRQWKKDTRWTGY